MSYNAERTDQKFLLDTEAALGVSKSANIPDKGYSDVCWPAECDEIVERLLRIVEMQGAMRAKDRDELLKAQNDETYSVPPITVGATLTEMMRDLGRLVTFCNGRGEFKVGHSGQVALLALDDLDDAVAEAGTADEEWPLEGG